MNDLVSRKALLAEYDRVHIGEPGNARKLIEEAPTVDAVEVVRCKDCKHYKSTLFCNFHKHRIEKIGTCTRFRFGWGYRIGKPDDFCSWG